MSRTGSNHESNRVDRDEQVRIMSRTRSNLESQLGSHRVATDIWVAQIATWVAQSRNMGRAKLK